MIFKNYERRFASVALIIGIIFISCSCCSSSNDESSQLESLRTQFLPREFQNTNFTLNDIKKIFREKCKKAIGSHNETLFNEIEVAAHNLTMCLKPLANVTVIQEEIEAARPVGDLDTVFHKYCKKAPEFEKCLDNFNDKVQPCLTKNERQQNAVLMRIVRTLIGFMCSKGGDQMALFVAEEGPECFDANKEAIANCANNSFAEYFPKDGKIPDLYNFSEFVLSPEHCVDFERFEKCTLHHLEQCREITPANIAESMFKFVKNETNCRTWIASRENQRSVLKDGNNASARIIFHSWFYIFAVMFTIAYGLNI